MAVFLSPLFNNDGAQIDANGTPRSGAKLFTYVAGSSTKVTTYQNSAGTTPHANPIILNSAGLPPAPIWLTSGGTVKFVLAPSTDSDPPASPILTIDNITPTNDTIATAASEWVASGVTPTYVSSSSFTLSGDQTTSFHVGRRIKITDGAGTDYAAISKAAFAADVTTITIDATSLTTPVTAVALGINSADNTSLPLNDSGIIAPDSPLAPHENLVITRPSAATVTITADKLVVTNTNGRKAVLSTVSVTPNIASAGANGLDTGTEANGTLYHLWVIWNGATVASLISLSATAPTMPSGYTHKGLVGAIWNDAGGSLVNMNQHGNYVSITAFSVLPDGAATSVTSVALSIIPPSAFRVLLGLGVDATSTTTVAGNIYSDAAGTVRAAVIGNVDTDNVVTLQMDTLVLLRVSQTLYYNVTNASIALDISVTGWIW